METQLPSPKRGTPPIFGRCLLWRKDWLDQDATWHGGRPRPRRHVLDGTHPSKRGTPAPLFGPCIAAKRLDGSRCTWYGGRPRPRLHCVRWGPSSPPLKGAHTQFSADVCCGQTTGWIKMPLGTEVGLGPGHIVLDGDPALLRQKVHIPQIFGPCLLWPNGWIDHDTTWNGSRPWPRPHCVRWGPSSPKKGTQPPIFGPCLCGQTVSHLS